MCVCACTLICVFVCACVYQASSAAGEGPAAEGAAEAEGQVAAAVPLGTRAWRGGWLFIVSVGVMSWLCEFVPVFALAEV